MYSMYNRAEAIRHLLARNVEDVIEKAHLEKALASGKKLRVKHGIDPTGEKIHIGRAVVLWKLKEFQDLGHKIVLIIGDFTAQIGDPSDKLAKRPFLSPAQIKKNLKSYLPQIGKILDLKKVEVRYNSEWLKKLNFQEISRLAENFSIQQMTARRNFKDRIAKGEDVSLRETFYALMQGYDSVAVKADVELGGTDQLFNLLAGRKIQSAYGQKPQDIMATKMLLGLDGRKMSTSWGNVINIADSPNDLFGKTMAMCDEQIQEYLELTSGFAMDEVRRYTELLKRGENPKHIKEKLAFALVARYHGEWAAKKAAEHFTNVFTRRHIAGAELPGVSLDRRPIAVLDLVFEIRTKIKKPMSRSEARRLIEQGGVSVDDDTPRDPQYAIVPQDGTVVRVGKKDFFRLQVK